MLCKQRNVSGTRYSAVLCSELIKHMHLAGMLYRGPAGVVGRLGLSLCFSVFYLGDCHCQMGSFLMISINKDFRKLGEIIEKLVTL